MNTLVLKKKLSSYNSANVSLYIHTTKASLLFYPISVKYIKKVFNSEIKLPGLLVESVSLP